MNSIREIITKWGFQIEHDKLDKVEKQLESIKHSLEFLAAAEIIKGLYELGERFARFGEELHIAAQSAGITVESFQKLAFAANQSSISQEEMGMSMARLARHLYEARRGSQEAQMAFSEAGFSGEQVNSFKTGQDVLMALADRFKATADPIKKQALAMQLLGRGSVHMVGFLSQGSDAIRGMGDEAERLGAILSERQVEALTKTEHSLQKLWGVLKAVGATIAAELSPSIETAINSFLKFYQANRKLIETNIRAWIWDITYALGFVFEAVKVVTQKFLDFAASHQTLVRRVFEAVMAFGLFVSAVFLAKKGLDVLGFVLGPVKSLFGFLGGILWTLAKAVFPILGEAVMAFGEFLLMTPIGWFIAGIGALIVVLHDAWKILTGGSFKDTWIGQAWEGLKGMTGKVLGFLGLGEDGDGKQSKSQSIVQSLTNVKNLGSDTIGKALSGLGSFGTGGEAPNYQMNAPITINVPSGMDHHMVAQKVKEGVREHMDRTLRETQRSLRPSQAY